MMIRTRGGSGFGLGSSYFMCPDGTIVTCTESGCPCPGTSTAPLPQPSGSGATSLGPTGPQPCGLSDAPLSPQAKALVEASGHSIDCMTIPASDPYSCPTTMCAVDGGQYVHGAYAINLDPGVLAVELGAASPVIAISQTGGAGAKVPTYTWENLTSPLNTSLLHVGDKWRLTIFGPPNSLVTVTGGKNGDARFKDTPLGKTDATGKLVIEGTAEADHVGRWTETYTINGVNSGTLTFEIATLGSVAGQHDTGGASDHGGGGSVSGKVTQGSSITGFLTENISIMGHDIPVWLLLAGTGLILYGLSRGGR
jgi:hypothetical protein